jgi:lipopolysaccharide/colanic/teichoic acid biosynthesis glycosyltransferase
MKRHLPDRVVAAAGLAALSLPLALAAAAVKATSAGPVFYRQPRIGRDGRPFDLVKFRTMRAGAAGAQITVAADSRVTPVGRVLRRLKIDELPQLWNVLKGDMALIGPRPEVPRFVAHYTAEQRAILRAMPGLASRAQLVYPHEADLLLTADDPEHTYVTQLMPKKIAVDLEYERRRTVWTDLGLIAELVLLVAGVRLRADHSVRISSSRPLAVAPAARTLEHD